MDTDVPTLSSVLPARIKKGMISADVLIMSRSALSMTAALIGNQSTVIWLHRLAVWVSGWGFGF